MTGEQALQPASVFTLCQPDKGFLQCDGSCRIIPGANHVFHTVIIRFALGLPAILLVNQVCGKTSPTNHIICITSSANSQPGSHHSALHQHAPLHSLGAVASGSVHNLMTEHSG